MDQRRMSAPLLGVTLSIAVIFGACGSVTEDGGLSRSDQPMGQTTATAEPDSEIVGPPTSTLSDRTPVGSMLNVVLLRGHTQSAVESDVQAAIDTCMTALGFEYEPVPAEITYVGEDVTRPHAEVFADRESRGYGFTLSLTQGMSAEDVLIQSMASEEQATYLDALGNSEGGCRAQAEAEVLSALPFYRSEYQSLNFEFASALRSDARIARALADWSVCMSESGYMFATSDDAQASFNRKVHATTLNRTEDGLRKLLAEEIALAVADSKCLATEFIPVRDSVERELLDSWVELGKLDASLWPLPTP